MSTKAKNFLRRMKQRLVIIFGIALLFFVVLIGRVIYISLAKRTGVSGRGTGSEDLRQSGYSV